MKTDYSEEFIIVKNTIENSGLFDVSYYRNVYYDFVKGESDLIRHYIQFGAALGFDPSPLFDTKYYIEQVNGLSESGLNPLYHYLVYGIKEHRIPFVLSKDEQVEAMDSYFNWCEKMRLAGRSNYKLLKDIHVILKSGEFDTEYYKSVSGIPKEDTKQLIRHYIEHGMFEGLNPNQFFDTRYYVNRYAKFNDMKNPFVHYLKIGRKKGYHGFSIGQVEHLNSNYKYMRYAYEQLKNSFGIINKNFLAAPISGLLMEYTINNVKGNLVIKSLAVINLIVSDGRIQEIQRMVDEIKRKNAVFEVKVISNENRKETIPAGQFVWEIKTLSTDIISRALSYMIFCADEEVLALVLDYDKGNFSEVMSGYEFFDVGNRYSPIELEHCIIKQGIMNIQDIAEPLETRILRAVEAGKIIRIGSNQLNEKKRASCLAIESDRKHILISQYAFNYGGGEIMPIRLANQLKKMGYSVLVHVFKKQEEDEKVRGMLLPEIPVVETENEDEMMLILKTHRIDVVNTHHQALQSFLARILKKEPKLRTQIRHIATSHGMYNAFSDEDLNFILSRLEGTVDCWTYVADKNIEPFVKNDYYNAEIFRKIPNGIEKPTIHSISRSELGINEDAFVFCLASRAIKEKGWNEAIRAINLARQQTGRDIQLVLIGDGPVYDGLIKDCPYGFVHLLGFKDNPCDYYAISNAMLLASYYPSESAPLSLIEALQCGIPVIASDIGDIRKMLELPDGMAGVVFELHDGEIPVERVVIIIEKLVTDERYYNRCREFANIKAKDFDIEVVAKQYLEVFNKEEPGYN